MTDESADVNPSRDLVDAHCHPTDDPLLQQVPHSNSFHEQDVPAGQGIDLDALAQRLLQAKVGTACIMSSNAQDQHLVEGLAGRCGKDRIVPAFGHHPWFTHWIAIDDGKDATSTPSKEGHYRSLFPDPPLLDLGDESVSELDLILPCLPDPVPLSRILSQLSDRLERFPHAILGEVGIDRSFRLPFPPSSHEFLDRFERKRKGGTDNEVKREEHAEGCTHGNAKRRLSRLQTPISHQLVIVQAQIGCAIKHRRPVSFHNVRASGHTTQLLENIARTYPTSWDEVPSFRDINLDLHSCTASASVIQQLQKLHPNVYVSFSTTINLRQKGLKEQIDAVDPKRILSESDWHSAEGLAERVKEIVNLFAASARIRVHLRLSDESTEEEAMDAVIHLLRENWNRFLLQGKDEETES